VTDVFFGFLAGWTLLLRRRQGRAAARIGQAQLGWFIGALGASMLPALIGSGGEVHFVGWLRFAQTVSLAWLVPYAVRTTKDARFILRAVVLFSSFEIVRSVLAEGAWRGLGDRLRGENGPDITGLLAAILVVAAVRGSVAPSRFARILLGLIGVAGLALTQSIGSIIATGIGLVLFGGLRNVRGERESRLLIPARVAVVMGAVALAVVFVRPENVPGADGYTQSTTAHRLIVGTAGVELFLAHPLTGVGWQHSDDPQVIGSRDIGDRLREIFRGDYNPGFFPDVQAASVHNAWIQVFAEAGIVGGAALVLAAVALTRGIRKVLRQSAANPEVYELAALATTILVVILVWWNDNPLYGAQPETVLAATMIGLLAALPNLPLVLVAPDRKLVRGPVDDEDKVLAPLPGANEGVSIVVVGTLASGTRDLATVAIAPPLATLGARVCLLDVATGKMIDHAGVDHWLGSPSRTRLREQGAVVAASSHVCASVARLLGIRAALHHVNHGVLVASVSRMVDAELIVAMEPTQDGPAALLGGRAAAVPVGILMTDHMTRPASEDQVAQVMLSSADWVISLSELPSALAWDSAARTIMELASPADATDRLRSD
jgi:O-antigen ligase